ncbi:MAG: zinc-dependent metalloprotease family protein, partial [Planctomycetota bacterium]
MQEQIYWVKKVYDHTGLKFNFAEPEYVENPELYEVAFADYMAIMGESQRRSLKQRELVIYLVGKLFSLDGNEVGGMANMPSNLYGSIFQHGVWIADNCFEWATAHELGHAFNLPHTWQDRFADTPSMGPFDCLEPVRGCNVMSYCNISAPHCGVPHTLSPQQISEIRLWAVN